MSRTLTVRGCIFQSHEGTRLLFPAKTESGDSQAITIYLQEPRANNWLAVPLQEQSSGSSARIIASAADMPGTVHLEQLGSYLTLTKTDDEDTPQFWLFSLVESQDRYAITVDEPELAHTA